MLDCIITFNAKGGVPVTGTPLHIENPPGRSAGHETLKLYDFKNHRVIRVGARDSEGTLFRLVGDISSE